MERHRLSLQYTAETNTFWNIWYKQTHVGRTTTLLVAQSSYNNSRSLPHIPENIRVWCCNPNPVQVLLATLLQKSSVNDLLTCHPTPHFRLGKQ